MKLSVVHYVTDAGKDLYQAWLERLKDKVAKAAITVSAACWPSFVQANAVQPARLPEGSLFVGLAVFGVATVLWLIVLFRRFGRVP
jgi:hypothetical protein